MGHECVLSINVHFWKFALYVCSCYDKGDTVQCELCELQRSASVAVMINVHCSG